MKRMARVAGAVVLLMATWVSAAVGIKQVSAGHSHTMILKNDGTLWATGYNSAGQLGDGTKVDKATPIKIMSGVASVSAGGKHTMILKTDGTLWATGYNSSGQLGDGTKVDKATPIKIMSGVASVSAGEYYTMIVKTDGTLWAVGENYYGHLGDGTAVGRTTPVQVMSDVASVSAGWSTTMILKTDGTLWTTGLNSDYLFGSATTDYRTTPIQVMSGVASVAVGEAHIMILKTDNTLWATGRNQDGELGDGTTTDRTTPIQIMSDAASVTVGLSHTMILKTDGTLWATGYNRYGQHGDGTANTKLTPNKISVYLKSTTSQTTEEEQPIILTTFMTDGGSLYSNPISLVVGTGTHYAVSGTTITPNNNLNGALTVPVRITDGMDTSTSVNMIIKVTPANDLPTLTSASSRTIKQANPVSLNIYMTNGNDIDGDPLSLVVGAGDNYTVSGTMVTPVATFSGTLTVPVRIVSKTDTTASVNMTITVLKDTPPTLTTATAQTIKEDQTITLTRSMTDGADADNDAMTLIVLPGENYTVSGTTVTPKHNFFGTLTVPVKIATLCDTTAPVNMTITVTENNSAPTMSSATLQTIGINASYAILPTMTNAKDPENDTLSILVLPGSNYSAVGSVVTPAKGFVGNLPVSIMASDGRLTSGLVTMIIVVDPAVAITTSEKKIPSIHFTTVPNPVLAGTESVTIAVPESIRGKAVCSIFDVQGNLLDEQSLVLGESKVIEWDLCNKGGIKVGSGTYVAILKVTAPDGTVQMFKTMIGVQR